MHGRILMTADTVGGVWHFSVNLARALAAHGVETAIATMGQRPDRHQRAQVKSLPSVTLIESDYRLEWMQDPWHDVAKAGDWLLRLESEFQPDLVHLNNYAHGALPWRAPVVITGHSCVLSWWSNVIGEQAPETYRKYAAAVRRGLQQADAVVAPSGAMLEWLERFYGPLPAPRVIYNGIADPIPDGLPGKKKRLLTTGRIWDAAKNIRLLMEAAPKLDWPLWVAGENQHPDGGSVSVSGVDYLGLVPAGDLKRYYRDAGIFVLPARYEPFGLSVLEAALSGCALVLGDIPTFRELWDGAAIFVDPSEPDMLVANINQITQDQKYREQLGHRAMARARRFRLEHTVSGYLDIYNDLLGSTTLGKAAVNDHRGIRK